MPGQLQGLDLGRTLFKNDLKRLPDDVRTEAIQRIKELLQHPMPNRLRMHSLNGYRPTVYVIDVAPNHAYQATFNLDGGIAIMRRIGTHKSISKSA